MLAGRQLPAVKRILDVGQPKILNQELSNASLSRVKEPISVFLEARVWAIIFVEPNANGAKQRK